MHFFADLDGPVLAKHSWCIFKTYVNSYAPTLTNRNDIFDSDDSQKLYKPSELVGTYNLTSLIITFLGLLFFQLLLNKFLQSAQTWLSIPLSTLIHFGWVTEIASGLQKICATHSQRFSFGRHWGRKLNDWHKFIRKSAIKMKKKKIEQDKKDEIH